MRKVTNKVASNPFARGLVLGGVSLSLILLSACSEAGGGREKITSRTTPTALRTASSNPQKGQGFGELSTQVCNEKEIFNLNSLLDKIRTDEALSDQAVRITTFDLRALTPESDILNGALTDASENVNANILLHVGLSYNYGLGGEAIDTSGSDRFKVAAHKECESYTLGEKVFTIDLERSNTGRLVLISDHNIRVYSSPSNSSLELVEYADFEANFCNDIQRLKLMSTYRLELNDGGLNGVEMSSNLLGLLFRHIPLSSQANQVAKSFLSDRGLPLSNSGAAPKVADVDYLELSDRLSIAEVVNGPPEKPTDFKLEACE